MRSEKILTITTGLWRPFTNQNKKNGGIACEIVRKAFGEMGFQVNFKFVPWKRAFELAKFGKADGTILWRRTAEREVHFLYSKAVLDVSVVFFHMKDFSFQWKTPKDLAGIRIGTIIGFDYDPAFNRAVAEGNLLVDETVSLEQNLRKILAGRIDISPMEKESGYYTLSQILPKEQASLFTHHATPLNASTLHLIMPKVSKESHSLIQIFNQGLEKTSSTKKPTVTDGIPVKNKAPVPPPR
ncbi:MAG: transporter substrate-binding domain-containing protein [Desulfobacterium sp.]|nr:transporter substrate-binding domain-containing protein [Desulfobacterium sp.]